MTRQFTFAGQRYTVQDRVTSQADITYLFGGYQFDIVSKPRGHFGLQAGVGYVNATGELHDQTFGFTGTETQTFPFPVAGAEFRGFPLRSPIIQISGELKGMALGDYGHYLDGSLNVGAGIGRHLTLLVGYRIVDADIHRQDQTRGITPRFGGPVFSLQVRR